MTMKFLNIMLAITVLIVSLPTRAADYNFSGTVVKQPCSLKPEETTISLDFGSVVKKELYQYGRNHGIPFALHLQDCDLGIGSTVTISFFGKEDSLLPGFAALAPGSTAKGVALGLEDHQGKALLINNSAEKIPLTPDENVLNFNIYVAVSQPVIDQKLIEAGSFNADMTFGLEYE